MLNANYKCRRSQRGLAPPLSGLWPRALGPAVWQQMGQVWSARFKSLSLHPVYKQTSTHTNKHLAPRDVLTACSLRAKKCKTSRRTLRQQCSPSSLCETLSPRKGIDGKKAQSQPSPKLQSAATMCAATSSPALPGTCSALVYLRGLSLDIMRAVDGHKGGARASLTSHF